MVSTRPTSPTERRYSPNTRTCSRPRTCGCSPTGSSTASTPTAPLPDDQLNADRRYFHLRSTRDGAYVGDFRLTGTAGAKLKTLLDPLAKPRVDPAGEVDSRTYGQRIHDALEDLCDRQLRAGDNPDAGGMPATVIVTIDADDLINRSGTGRTADGTLISTAKLLQMANNAEIIPTVLAASGAVLDLGRSRRIASRSQTLALIARDGGCSFPAARTHPILRTPPHPGMDRRRTDEPEQSDFALRLSPSQFPGPRLDLQDQQRRDSGVDSAEVGRPGSETHDQHPNPGRPHRPETRTTEQADRQLSWGHRQLRSAGGSVPVRACHSAGLRSRPAVRQAAATQDSGR